MSRANSTKEIVRYWHPYHGGWHHAYLIRTEQRRKNRRLVQVMILKDARRGGRRRVVLASDVRELAE